MKLLIFLFAVITCHAAIPLQWNPVPRKQVAASGGGGYTSPTNDSPYAWFDGDNNATQTNYLETQAADNESLGGWLDKSGNGRHVFGPVTTASLKRQTLVVNGKAMAEGGSTVWMDNSLLAGGTLSTPCTMYVAWRNNSSGTFVGIIDNTNSTAGQTVSAYKSNGEALGWGANGTDAAGATTVANPGNYIICAVFDGASSVVYTNRVLYSSGTVGSATLAGLTIGNLDTHLHGGGFVGELMLFSGADTAAQMTNTVNWLNFTNHGDANAGWGFFNY